MLSEHVAAMSTAAHGLTPKAAVLRPYFRNVYRDASIDAWPDQLLAERWAQLTWVYHTPVPSLRLAFAQDFHHAHPSVCQAPDPDAPIQQPGLLFCPTVKVRNMHWFGYWRPATTLLHGCEQLRALATSEADERPVPPFVDDNAWFEVTRVATKVVTGAASVIRKFGEGGGHGCWFLGAQGSGVYLNVGRSLRIHNRTELMHRLGYPPTRSHAIKKRNFFVEMDTSVEVCSIARQQVTRGVNYTV